MDEFVFIVIFSILGFFLGCFTGLVPGLHVNTLSMILLASSHLLIKFLPFAHNFACLLICSLIVSISIAHTFVNIIPATVLGVPDEDSALTILPAHRLLLNGRGYEAIVLSSIGSFGAILASIFLLFPYKCILGEPLNFYTFLRTNLFWILLSIVLLMIFTEGAGRKDKIWASLKASFVILLSGLLGLLSLDFPVSSPFGLPSSTLMPLLAGLFGLSNQINSLVTKAKIERQLLEEPEMGNKKEVIISVFSGSIAGAIVSVVPGITSAIGTILALGLRGSANDKQIIVTLSAVNTSCAFFVISALFAISRARSGAALVIANLLNIDPWKGLAPPLDFLYFLIPMVIAGFLSFPMTCFLGKFVLGRIEKVPYALLTKISIIFIVIVTFIFTGFHGLLLLFTSTAIGMIPIWVGVRRSNCMGVLLIPIMLNLLT